MLCLVGSILGAMLYCRGAVSMVRWPWCCVYNIDGRGAVSMVMAVVLCMVEVLMLCLSYDAVVLCYGEWPMVSIECTNAMSIRRRIHHTMHPR